MWWLIEELFSGNIISYIAIIVSIVAINKSLTLRNDVESLKDKLNNAIQNGIDVKQNNQQFNIQDDQSLSQNSAMNNITKDDMTDKSSNNNIVVEDSAFMKWLKEDWLMKLGGILVFIGVVIFLGMIFDSVDATGKVSIGLLFGLTVIGIGLLIARKNPIPGMSINVLGSCIAIFTIYIARTPDFNLFEPITVTVLILFIAVYLAFCAYKYKMQSVAHIGLIVANITPILAQSGSNNYLGLFIYLGVISFGILWLTSITNWRGLLLSSQIFMIIYSFFYFGSSIQGFSIPLMFVIISIGLLYLIVSILGVIKNKDTYIQGIDLYIAGLNLIFCLYWVIERIPSELQAMSLIIIGLVYLIAFFLVYQFTRNIIMFLVYAGSSAVLFLVATYLLLEIGEWLTLAWLLETLIIVFTFNKLSEKEIFASNLLPITFILSIPALLSAFETTYNINNNGTISASNLIISILAIIITAILGFLFNDTIKRINLSTSKIGITYYAIAVLLFIITIWQTTHTIFSDGIATLISLLIFTIIGSVITIIGKFDNNQDKIKIGRYILIAVAIRILFVDAWKFGTIIGVVICIVVGIILIAVTILTKTTDDTKSINQNNN